MWRKVMANRGNNNNNNNNNNNSIALLTATSTASSSIASSASSSLSSSQALANLPVVHSEEVAPVEPHSGSSTTSSSDSPTPLLPASASHSRNQVAAGDQPYQAAAAVQPAGLHSAAGPQARLHQPAAAPHAEGQAARHHQQVQDSSVPFRQGGGAALKREMQAVLLMDEDWVDDKFGVQMQTDDSQAGMGMGMAAAVDSGRREDVIKRVTHEDMHLMMEQILRDEGYYACQDDVATNNNNNNNNNNNDILSSGSSGVSSSSGGVDWKEGEWRLELRVDSGGESDGSSADGRSSRRRAQSDLQPAWSPPTRVACERSERRGGGGG